MTKEATDDIDKYVFSLISDESKTIMEIIMSDTENPVKIMFQHWCLIEFVRLLFSSLPIKKWHIHHLYQE